MSLPTLAVDFGVSGAVSCADEAGGKQGLLLDDLHADLLPVRAAEGCGCLQGVTALTKRLSDFVRSGPTRYYFYIGGHRHYYGTRNHGQCNGDCNQDVFMNKAAGTMWVSAPAGQLLNQADFKSKLSKISRNLGGTYGISPSLISVDSNINVPANDVGGYRPVSFSIYLPDGVNAVQFEGDLELQACSIGSSLSTAFSPWTLADQSVPGSPCAIGAGRSAVFVTRVKVQASAVAGGAFSPMPSLVLAACAALAWVWH